MAHPILSIVASVCSQNDGADSQANERRTVDDDIYLSLCVGIHSQEVIEMKWLR